MTNLQVLDLFFCQTLNWKKREHWLFVAAQCIYNKISQISKYTHTCWTLTKIDSSNMAWWFVHLQFNLWMKTSRSKTGQGHCVAVLCTSMTWWVYKSQIVEQPGTLPWLESIVLTTSLLKLRHVQHWLWWAMIQAWNRLNWARLLQNFCTACPIVCENLNLC